MPIEGGKKFAKQFNNEAARVVVNESAEAAIKHRATIKEFERHISKLSNSSLETLSALFWQTQRSTETDLDNYMKVFNENHRLAMIVGMGALNLLVGGSALPTVVTAVGMAGVKRREVKHKRDREALVGIFRKLQEVVQLELGHRRLTAVL